MSQLKDVYTKEFLTTFANQVTEYKNNFKTTLFVDDILSDNWEELSLRERMKKIAMTLESYLDGDYEEQLPIILKLHEKNRGFNFLFLPDFVSLFGLNKKHFHLSLDYLKRLTTYSSSEFAIREFILMDYQAVFKLLLEWSLDSNEHIRRLASEGSRPVLPWGVKLTIYDKTPEISLPILENLKNDSSLYVRKSVANHLNDLSKKNPDLIVNLSQNWQGISKETDWMIKRANRTLIKQAYPPALSLFGYQKPGQMFDIFESSITTKETELYIGDELTFSYFIKTSNNSSTPIRLEFGIDYIKANGKPSLKKFHLFDGLSDKSNFSGTKRISFKNLTTRKHYSGEHKIYLFMNGYPINETKFSLKIKSFAIR
ncbi:hypothetical protein [Vagococcus fluvialis]|uniref:hypothetical protein n=1 Tax=Vagococcus fluvialis TaxID=2738 RepID=UPI001D09E1C6|nr:hypothetical protein [Vagococcus fluvialis]UDM71572.1 hypothetical protein K5L00_02080 [Vagococcus fluvialis]UDM76434.1 hypothetical protein K5K98_11880 [Vagococcus fluvialis]UDM83264.1 hypothetical protein K5K96_04560 [Vagococcus fluvialis]